LTLADRATIANMAPEYGATMGFFPVDHMSAEYLKQTGRDPAKIELIEKYLKAQGLWRTYEDGKEVRVILKREDSSVLYDIKVVLAGQTCENQSIRTEDHY
jgi:homoaconitase/3-isopropylmalate dehydratase large subunit